MQPSQTKKLLIINILDILQKKTDENHRMTQKEIQDLLETDYQMTVDRKAVKRSLMELTDFGYPIEHDEIPRGNQPEADPICTNWYLNRKITDAELRLLIDTVQFAKYIPLRQREGLIKKLAGLSSEHFSLKVRHLRNLSEQTEVNKQLFFTIELLDEAIEKKQKVSFYYEEYQSDKKLHHKLDWNGEPIVYTVSPYQMVVNGGRYYLIANTDGHDNLSHYRIDRITMIPSQNDAVAKPLRNLAGGGASFDLSSYMAEHIYMHAGEDERVSFRVPKKHLPQVFDWFEPDTLRFSEEDEQNITVSTCVNLSAIKYWAIQYCLIVEILSPKSLREEVAKALAAAAGKYK